MPNGVGFSSFNTEEAKKYRLNQIERVERLNEINKK
jgi:hypothetical protein